MKNFFRLLFIVGLLTAGWLNRDKLRGFGAKAEVPEDSGGAATPEPAAPTATSSVTPHPAIESRQAAAKAYPALRIPDSAFHKRFLSLYEEAQFREPALLSDPNWPLKLAERTAISLGGGAMPTPLPPSAGTKPSSKLQGSALDMRPRSAPAH